MNRRQLFGLLLVLCSGRAAAAPAYHPTHGSEMLWDRYGVAHVYARNVTDLFYAFGWAQIRSHGDIIARLYAEARGRAAEYFGADELENDRWMAINDVPARAQSWLRAQEPSFRRKLEAFAAGMNAYARTHPEALSADARRVFPMSAADVLAHQERMFQFVYAAPANIVNRIPPDAAPPLREPPGSNGWAIAPSRSASGHAMLLMNPHLYWAPGWARYYEIQLTAPGIDLYGATQVGLPVLRFMFSDYVGFTHTVNAPHGVTFYAIQPSGDGYRYDGRVLPLPDTRADTQGAPAGWCTHDRNRHGAQHGSGTYRRRAQWQADRHAGGGPGPARCTGAVLAHGYRARPIGLPGRTAPHADSDLQQHLCRSRRAHPVPVHGPGAAPHLGRAVVLDQYGAWGYFADAVDGLPQL